MDGNPDPQNFARARKMRRTPSAAEAIAWELLRSNRTGFKFRRQHTFGPHIFDFFCFEALLALEFDGEQHDPLRDAKRDLLCAEQGVLTMRVPNRDFFLLDENVSFWLTDLVRLCEARTGRAAFPDLKNEQV